MYFPIAKVLHLLKFNRMEQHERTVLPRCVYSMMEPRSVSRQLENVFDYEVRRIAAKRRLVWKWFVDDFENLMSNDEIRFVDPKDENIKMAISNIPLLKKCISDHLGHSENISLARYMLETKLPDDAVSVYFYTLTNNEKLSFLKDIFDYFDSQTIVGFDVSLIELLDYLLRRISKYENVGILIDSLMLHDSNQDCFKLINNMLYNAIGEDLLQEKLECSSTDRMTKEEKAKIIEWLKNLSRNYYHILSFLRGQLQLLHLPK